MTSNNLLAVTDTFVFVLLHFNATNQDLTDKLDNLCHIFFYKTFSHALENSTSNSKIMPAHISQNISNCKLCYVNGQQGLKKLCMLQGEMKLQKMMYQKPVMSECF